jgi:RNA polymerase sigma factor (TIGR02999 family)
LLLGRFSSERARVAEPEDVTALLQAASAGSKEASDALMPVVYEELRRRAAALMGREEARHTLQPTALVNEAWMRLIRQDRVDWQGRAHFFAVASEIMRRILVDHARGRLRTKRGGDQVRVSLDEGMGLSIERDADVLAVHEAVERLAALDARQAEIVVMRFFGGLTVQEVASVIGVSVRTVEAEWTMIKAWLRRELTSA